MPWKPLDELGLLTQELSKLSDTKDFHDCHLPFSDLSGLNIEGYHLINLYTTTAVEMYNRLVDDPSKGLAEMFNMYRESVQPTALCREFFKQ